MLTKVVIGGQSTDMGMGSQLLTIAENLGEGRSQPN